MEHKKVSPIQAQASTGYVGVLCVVVLLCVTSSQPITGAEDLFIPLMCTADATVGLHEAYQEEENETTETYEPRTFSKSKFSLTENQTFRELLSDEDVDLYLTLQDLQTDVTFEYSCMKIKGWGERTGYSCVNSPPTEMLAIDPAILRFSRASVGAWTFYTAEDLSDSAVLFVEKGTCVHTTSEHNQSDTQERSN